MVSLIQSFPPYLIAAVASNWRIQDKPSSSYSALTSFPKHRRTSFIVSAANPDDYHATLKALNSRNRFPRKSLGQHYMLNSTVNEQLVSVANVKNGDLVLEIGPGTGSLTNVLIVAGATVLAIEKDPHMAALVKERFADTDRLKVLEEDFTRCHIRSHMLSLLEGQNLAASDIRRAKVVANIPFNISKDVVKQLLPMGDIFSEVVLLLQDEAALRLVEPSSKSSEYRPINVFVKFYSEWQFMPLMAVNTVYCSEMWVFGSPKVRCNILVLTQVDAAVVTFKLKHPSEYPSVPSIESFFSLVHSAFNGKRKMLRKTLQHMFTSSEIEAALDGAGLPATSRPDELTLDDFVKLHNSLASS
ncbi:hypothetical protein Cgig2_033374 [Carnegiea gigantea]|uniref:rRNA adenine N(6)-methyltransferase n=1 Tax=Carnegiea gigantea TaxID=171969 RepID=A0A9Q1QS09_9CARY|nr:hypothetical protein Cgig2_033374 [Carnegiea gigantea]